MLDKQIIEFNENILSLRDFIQQTEPVFLEKSKEHDRFVKPLLLLASVNKILKKENLSEEKLSDLNEKKNQVEEIVKNLDSSLKDINSVHKGSKIAVAGIDLSSESIEKWALHFKGHNSYKSHMKLLYKNTLISLMSSTEWFFAQILHFYYNKFPESSGINDKSLTFSDLKKYQSIVEAERYLIEQKIENILRGNIESWFEYIKKDFKLKLSYLDNEIEEIVEVSQRRNLFIHNGGVINSLYLAKVSQEVNPGIKNGEMISITKEYLDNSLGKLQLIFTLIALELWKKLDPDDQNRAQIMNDIIYENLLKGRWFIAKGFSEFLITDLKMPPEFKVIAQLNNWLCRIRSDSDKQVLDELNEADFSDKKEIYQIALHALKGEIQEFFKKLPSVLKSGQIGIKQLEEFPIFEDVRNTSEYKGFKEGSSYFNMENNKIAELNMQQTIDESISINNDIVDKAIESDAPSK